MGEGGVFIWNKSRIAKYRLLALVQPPPMRTYLPSRDSRRDMGSRLHHPLGREDEAPRAHAERVERIETRARTSEDAGATLGRVGSLAVSVERAHAVARFVIRLHEVLGARRVVRGVLLERLGQVLGRHLTSVGL